MDRGEEYIYTDVFNVFTSRICPLGIVHTWDTRARILFICLFSQSVQIMISDMCVYYYAQNGANKDSIEHIERNWIEDEYEIY